MANQSAVEERVKQLEYLVEKLRADLAATKAIASQAQEDADHMEFPSESGADPVRFQVLAGGVGASTNATLGTGTVRLQTVISGKRYNLTDGTAGHYTDVDVVNDTFTALVSKDYGIAEYVGGELTVVVGSCTPSATFSTDDITAGGG